MKGAQRASWFQRLVLPGLAFKAVVIGGGYATGRELAEFFLPSGPWGGLAAMMLATAIWSAVCIVTFLFARASGARDYHAFFRALLGPGCVVHSTDAGSRARLQACIRAALQLSEAKAPVPAAK